jgi:hypothetical protein
MNLKFNLQRGLYFFLQKCFQFLIRLEREGPNINLERSDNHFQRQTEIVNISPLAIFCHSCVRLQKSYSSFTSSLSLPYSLSVHRFLSLRFIYIFFSLSKYLSSLISLSPSFTPFLSLPFFIPSIHLSNMLL